MVWNVFFVSLKSKKNSTMTNTPKCGMVFNLNSVHWLILFRSFHFDFNQWDVDDSHVFVRKIRIRSCKWYKKTCLELIYDKKLPKSINVFIIPTDGQNSKCTIYWKDKLSYCFVFHIPGVEVFASATIFWDGPAFWVLLIAWVAMAFWVLLTAWVAIVFGVLLMAWVAMGLWVLLMAWVAILFGVLWMAWVAIVFRVLLIAWVAMVRWVVTMLWAVAMCWFATDCSNLGTENSLNQL